MSRLQVQLSNVGAHSIGGRGWGSERIMVEGGGGGGGPPFPHGDGLGAPHGPEVGGGEGDGLPCLVAQLQVAVLLPRLAARPLRPAARPHPTRWLRGRQPPGRPPVNLESR